MNVTYGAIEGSAAPERVSVLAASVSCSVNRASPGSALRLDARLSSVAPSVRTFMRLPQSRRRAGREC